MKEENKIEVKQVEELKGVELDQFNQFYIQYFEELTNRDSRGILKRLRNKLLCNDNRLFAKIMIDKLFNKEREGFISTYNDDVTGFIVCNFLDKENAWISHFYLDNRLLSKRKQLTRIMLYKNLVDSLKKKGIKKLITDVSNEDVILIDFLESLNFTRNEAVSILENEEKITYEKRI